VTVKTVDPPRTADLAARLSVAILRLRARLREEAAMITAGFTISQLGVLDRIVATGPTTAAELAAVEHVSQQAIAQSVTALKEAGLVRGKRDSADGRKVLISVTAAGRKMRESVYASREAWLAQAIDSVITPKELADLDVTIELLERLAEAELSHRRRSR
jgi:DNA-binding MarR family transcriptional regulator